MLTKKAFEIDLDDVIIYKQKPFVVWDKDVFFKNEEFFENHNSGDIIPFEEMVFTFYHEKLIEIEGLVETVIENVPFDKEFYFIGSYKPEYESPKDKRAISKSLRFKVLFRDNFKCVLCGRGAEHDVQLHIDHITPHSLGGKTEEENLQTLCSSCNLGKGNKAII